MLKVMTFNLRNEASVDGINRFWLRTERVLDAIFSESPDLIGFQEAPDNAREFLRKALCEEYYVVGGGPNQSYRTSGNALAFKRDRFELIGFETKWLSPTPDTPGSRYTNLDQSQYCRNYHLAKLRIVGKDQILYFVNTHTDHVGAASRTFAAKQLLELLKGLEGSPRVLVGDLNATPDEESIQILSSASSTGIADVTQHIGGTYHGFGALEVPEKIDYIFTDLPCLESHAVKDEPINGVYISDHTPVVATLELDMA